MKKIKTCDLFSVSTHYLNDLFNSSLFPWEILPKIKDYMNIILSNPPQGFSLLKNGVLVGENVEISPLATIIPPAVIGSNSSIRPGAYLRGAVFVGENCVVGNSCELKNCILLDNVQVPHYNYVGDSVLGNGVHLGAGVICSNLKADKADVIIHADLDYPTSLRKVGCFLGDKVDVGCNSVINPGSIVGKNTRVYPLSFIRNVIGENYIIKQNGNIIKQREFNNT